MIYIKYCLKCNRAFDMETNYNICPECRKKEVGEENGLE